MLLLLITMACGPEQVTDVDGDGVDGRGFGGDDCNDGDATIFPGAPDPVCDKIDQNCDGGAEVGFLDRDGDGHGSPGDFCGPDDGPEGYVESDDDCDDDHATVYQGAPELCDKLDNDCNGAIDAGALRDTDVYPDRDGDGYGETARGTRACEGTDAYIAIGGDCDDLSASRNPDGFEQCGDGVDQDCDGLDTHCPPFLLDDATVRIDADLGASLCAGDFDGNLDNELVVGNGYRAAATGLWLMFDGASTSSADAVAAYEGGSGLGGVCASADLNRDGADDLFLLGNSAVYLVYGHVGSLQGASLDTLDNAHQLDDSPGGLMGGALLAGDINYDGRTDIIVGAPDGSVGSGDKNGVGNVYVLHSRTKAVEDGPINDTVGVIFHGEPAEGYAFGSSLGLVDTDADGWYELAVGDTMAAGETARIYLFNQVEVGVDQATSVMQSDAPFTMQAERTSGFASVLASGDLQGTGYGALATPLSDSILMIPANDIPPLGSGRVDPEDAAATTIVGQPGIGRAITIGDFDGDGADDLVFTALDADSDDGRAFLFRGPLASGLIEQTAADFSVIGDDGVGLGVSTAIVASFDTPAPLWAVGASSGVMFGFVFPEE